MTQNHHQVSEVSKTARVAGTLGVHSRGNGPFSAGNRNTIEDSTSQAAKVSCFTVRIGARNSGNCNTIEDLIAEMSNLSCFTVHFATPAGGQPDPHGSDVNNGAGDTGPALPLAN